MPMAFPPGVSAQDWERARKQAIARSGGICALCGEPLNPAAATYSPDATEVDHKIPRHAVRHLSRSAQRANFLDPSNLAAVHRICNQRKGDGTAPEVVGAQSREW